MNKHAIITIAGIFIFIVSSQAQDKPMNRLSTGVFRYESIDETINRGVYYTNFLNGLYYQRVMSKTLQGVIGINMQNKMIDDGGMALDGFYGNGDFKEAEVLLGIVDEISIKSCTRLKPVLGADVFYASSNYSGDFSGGFSGQGYTFDNRYDKFGVAGDAGISFEPLNNLVLTALTSVKFSRIFEERKLEDLKTSYNSLKWTPVEILLGVKF